jgi:hypothetical protein
VNFRFADGDAVVTRLQLDQAVARSGGGALLDRPMDVLLARLDDEEGFRGAQVVGKETTGAELGKDAVTTAMFMEWAGASVLSTVMKCARSGLLCDDVQCRGHAAWLLHQLARRPHPAISLAVAIHCADAVGDRLQTAQGADLTHVVSTLALLAARGQPRALGALGLAEQGLGGKPHLDISIAGTMHKRSIADAEAAGRRLGWLRAAMRRASGLGADAPTAGVLELGALVLHALARHLGPAECGALVAAGVTSELALALVVHDGRSPRVAAEAARLLAERAGGGALCAALAGVLSAADLPAAGAAADALVALASRGGAGLDEGLLSFALSNLLYMVNPYSYNKYQ